MVKTQQAAIRLVECIEHIDHWMIEQNRLTLNGKKMRLLWLRTRQQLAKLLIAFVD